MERREEEKAVTTDCSIYSERKGDDRLYYLSRSSRIKVAPLRELTIDEDDLFDKVYTPIQSRNGCFA